jgi:hypothetical protein
MDFQGTWRHIYGLIKVVKTTQAEGRFIKIFFFMNRKNAEIRISAENSSMIPSGSAPQELSNEWSCK